MRTAGVRFVFSVALEDADAALADSVNAHGVGIS